MAETLVNYQKILSDELNVDDMFEEDVDAAALEEQQKPDQSDEKIMKNAKRKRNRKSKSLKKQQQQEQQQKDKTERTTKKNADDSAADTEKENDDTTTEDSIEIEFVPEEIELEPSYSMFSHIFDHFKFGSADDDGGGGDNNEKKKSNTEEAGAESTATTATAAMTQASSKAAEIARLTARMLEDEEEEERERVKDGMDEDGKPRLSKKKLKKMTRLSVAALKQLVNKPDVVEMHDVTARDPKLLVHLKATKNTVAVPRHWCAKRTYLQGKRGFEKPAFDLPDFIKRTGISAMREAVAEKDSSKSLKQQMREKVRPKMGKIDIDYQKLHDAFFRYQTKPRMSIHGDLYYEGKELETKLKEKKPGNLTDDLRISLGMPSGAQADKVPPPWLIAMQRYGPPPSYPSLKIPGLNAPIPDGCSFGYHAGGWGKPPVDEYGRPLYGDVFGSAASDRMRHKSGEDDEGPVDQTLWGEMEEEVYEGEVESDSDDDQAEEEEDEQERERDQEQEQEEGVNESNEAEEANGGEQVAETPSGISTSTTTAGLETPDMIELRKRKTQIESDMESMSHMGSGLHHHNQPGETPALYKILPEKAASIGGAMMGSSKVYDVSGTASSKANKQQQQQQSVDMTLNPDELEMTSDVLQSRFDQHLKQHAGAAAAAGRDGQETNEDPASKKRKKQQQQQQQMHSTSGTATSEKEKNKKHKEFKF